MSATRVIQTAIYGVLTGDGGAGGVSTLVGGRIYNDVPDGSAYPLVLISKATETPWHTMGGPSSGLGWKNIIRIHIYSRYQGDKEAMEILERIVTVLNFVALTVTGFSQVMVEYEQGRVLVEDVDKIETRHLIGEFNVQVRQ